MKNAKKRKLRQELARGYRFGSYKPGDPNGRPQKTNGAFLIGQAVAREFRARGRKPTPAELRALERNVLSIPETAPITSL